MYFYEFYLLLTIIQIFSMVKLGKKNNIYWNIFMGITLSNYISIGMNYLNCDIDGTMDLGGAIFIIFVSLVMVIINTIMLIGGIVVKKKTKNDSKFNFKFLITGIICVIISAILIIAIPTYRYNRNKRLASEKALEFLNNKYGNCDFEVTEAEYDFTDNGITQKSHTGYEVKVLSKKYNQNFVVKLNYNFENPYERDFLDNYYKEKIRKNVLEKYGVDVNIKLKTYNIPKNFNKIPTMDDLIKYNAIDEIYVYVYRNNILIYDLTEKSRGRYEFIKDVSIDFIKELDITKDFEYNFTKLDYDNSLRYLVEKEGNTLRIIDSKDIKDKDVSYEYDLSKEKNKK